MQIDLVRTNTPCRECDNLYRGKYILQGQKELPSVGSPQLDISGELDHFNGLESLIEIELAFRPLMGKDRNRHELWPSKNPAALLIVLK